MALAVIGNSHVGNNYLTTYTFEEEDDDGEYCEVEKQLECVLDTGSFVGYRIRLPTATYEKKMFAHIYQRFPSSEDYDWEIGLDTFLAFPLVYKCDANGKFAELMNTNLPVLERDVEFTGWIDCEIALKQNLNAGDYVFVGFYAGTWNPVWDVRPAGINGIPYEIFYWSGTHYYGDIQELVQNGSILAYRTTDYDGGDEYYSLYFQYYDSPLRTDYVRSVSSSGRANSLLARKAKLKISFFGNEVVQDASVRSAGFAKTFFENIGFIDFAVRLFGWVCKVFSVVGNSDLAERSGMYRREENSESDIVSSVVAGRLVFRAVATMLGLWDWLKSKIRNENCVVELFTPITDELRIDN